VARALQPPLAQNRGGAASRGGHPRRDATPAEPRTRELADPGATPGPTLPHKDRVRARLHAWQDIGAPRRVLTWLHEGVRVHWNDRGPPAPFHHGVSAFTPAERAWLTLERDRCLATGAWVRAKERTHVSRAFVTYHRGKPRLVIDLRYVNLHTRKCPCVFEPLSSLRRMCRKGDWMCSLDLTDAYHHVPFHESAVRYFTFAIETLHQDGQPRVEYFSTPVLNFGWTNSPFYFTEVLKSVVTHLRCPDRTGRAQRTGVRTLPWLDDFAFFFKGDLTREQARQERDNIFSLFRRLGLAIAPDKGVHDPTRVLPEHLGYQIDTERGLFLLTKRREKALVHGAHHLLHLMSTSQGWVPSRSLASFAGLAEASGLALPLGRFMLRALYDDLATRRGWGGKVLLSTQSRTDLRWWARLPTQAIGRAIWRPPCTRHMWTDASDLGWGGALQPHLRLRPAHGFWSPQEVHWHITCKELVAVHRSVRHFLPYLAGHRVVLHEDNTAVVWILTNFVSRSPVLMRELRSLWAILARHDIALHPTYIASAQNVIADEASRMAAARDYCIKRSTFVHIQRLWGACTVDAFASAATAQLPRFWSRSPQPSAEATDAFAQEWRGERLWVHPPPSLLPTVVQQLEHTRAVAYVCAPRWPGAQWYGMLAELSEEVLHLPPGHLLPVAGDAHHRLHSWPLSVFKINPGATPSSSAP